LKSYINERRFETKFNAKISSLFHILSDVPKGAFLVLFSMYYTHLVSRETILGTSADDTAIIATHEDSSIASLNLQERYTSSKNG